MRLKNSQFFNGLWAVGFLLAAVAGDSVKAESPKKEAPHVIVNSPSPAAAQASMTEGMDSIVGEASPSVSRAYRNWKYACQEWKSELKKLNRGNLLFASCGKVAKRNEGPSVIYESRASYKIRVGCP